MTRLIKKYKNRRLYDTERSQYITIEELQHYVNENILFHVEEASSGKDITNTVLLQILVEMETGPTQFFSTDVLRQLIRLANQPVSKPFKTMFEEMMTFMSQQLKSNSYLNDYQSARENWEKQMQDAFTQWQKWFK